MNKLENQKGYAEIIVVLIVCSIVIGVVAGIMFAYPKYRLYSQELRGKANLLEAKQSKMIQVEQARAELESADLRAKAIVIMGKAAEDYPSYRQQEFVGAFGEALREGKINQIIYVPTEGNIPILEAGKRVTKD